MKLPVVVRRMRASKELIALFVTRPATDDPALCWAYTMNLSLTAVDPNHVMRATDGVGTRDAQEFVSKNITASLYREMGLIGRVQFEIHQRDRREENLASRNLALRSKDYPRNEKIETYKAKLLSNTKVAGLDYVAYRIEQSRLAREYGITAIDMASALLLPDGEFDAAFKKSLGRFTNVIPKKEQGNG